MGLHNEAQYSSEFLFSVHDWFHSQDACPLLSDMTSRRVLGAVLQFSSVWSPSLRTFFWLSDGTGLHDLFLLLCTMLRISLFFVFFLLQVSENFILLLSGPCSCCALCLSCWQQVEGMRGTGSMRSTGSGNLRSWVWRFRPNLLVTGR